MTDRNLSSPDADWRDPSFALRRLLRQPTAPLDAYAAPPMTAEARDTLRARMTAARREGGPAVCMILGAMPRSGTNYVERLMAGHPDVAIAPGGLRELPAFAVADRFRDIERAMARFHPSNGEIFAAYEWLGYALAGYVNRVRVEAAPGTRAVMLKDPHMRRVALFDALMPREQAILVIRDGRYLVDSTVRTWPLRRFGRTFEDVCLECRAATEAALSYAAAAPADQVRLVRYEDVTADPAARIAELCGWIGLDPARLDAAAVTNAPILGSSTHSRGADGAVGWAPVADKTGFDPTSRSLDWPDSWRRVFERVCGPAQERAGYARA